MRFLRSRRARILAAIVAALVVLLCVLTAVLFVYPDLNAPAHSDAIVVLGGHGVPAFDKGVELAKDGYAPDLVLSLQTWMHCQPYKSYLAPRLPRVKIMCFTADPQSTQGEARSIARLAKQLDWKRIIVVVLTTQATRARLRIGRCYPGQVLEVGFSPEGIGEWLFQFAYQWGALFKALVLQPSC
jgi:hypothetical protein